MYAETFKSSVELEPKMHVGVGEVRLGVDQSGRWWASLYASLRNLGIISKPCRSVKDYKQASGMTMSVL